MEESKVILVFKVFAIDGLSISPPAQFPPCDVGRLDVGEDAKMSIFILNYNQCLGLMQIVYICAHLNATQGRISLAFKLQ